MTSLSQVHSVTNRLLNAEKNAYGELFAATDELHKLLLQITGIDNEIEEYRQHLLLESGNAIGLTWAAMCIKDLKRTKGFADGIYEAVCDVRSTNPGRAIHILYAGTGPFATLVLPLTARFSSEQLQFTFLEVNESSFNCLQRLISKLELEEYIHRIEKADATKWLLPPNEMVDIFITETMQQGLRSEPQVAICMNLVPQLQKNTVVIPGQIMLKAALFNTSGRAKDKVRNNKPANSIHLLGSIFTLNKASIHEHTGSFEMQSNSPYCFPELIVTVPGEVASRYPVLYALTEIVIYKENELLIDECSLTMPLKMAELSKNQPSEIRFHYQMGQTPGIQFTMEETLQVV